MWRLSLSEKTGDVFQCFCNSTRVKTSTLGEEEPGEIPGNAQTYPSVVMYHKLDLWDGGWGKEIKQKRRSRWTSLNLDDRARRRENASTRTRSLPIG